MAALLAAGVGLLLSSGVLVYGDKVLDRLSSPIKSVDNSEFHHNFSMPLNVSPISIQLPFPYHPHVAPSFIKLETRLVNVYPRNYHYVLVHSMDFVIGQIISNNSSEVQYLPQKNTILLFGHTLTQNTKIFASNSPFEFLIVSTQFSTTEIAETFYFHPLSIIPCLYCGETSILNLYFTIYQGISIIDPLYQFVGNQLVLVNYVDISLILSRLVYNNSTAIAEIKFSQNDQSFYTELTDHEQNDNEEILQDTIFEEYYGSDIGNKEEILMQIPETEEKHETNFSQENESEKKFTGVVLFEEEEPEPQELYTDWKNIPDEINLTHENEVLYSENGELFPPGEFKENEEQQISESPDQGKEFSLTDVTFTVLEHPDSANLKQGDYNEIVKEHNNDDEEEEEEEDNTEQTEDQKTLCEIASNTEVIEESDLSNQTADLGENDELQFEKIAEAIPYTEEEIEVALDQNPVEDKHEIPQASEGLNFQQVTNFDEFTEARDSSQTGEENEFFAGVEQITEIFENSDSSYSQESDQEFLHTHDQEDQVCQTQGKEEPIMTSSHQLNPQTSEESEPLIFTQTDFTPIEEKEIFAPIEEEQAETDTKIPNGPNPKTSSPLLGHLLSKQIQKEHDSFQALLLDCYQVIQETKFLSKQIYMNKLEIPVQLDCILGDKTAIFHPKNTFLGTFRPYLESIPIQNQAVEGKSIFVHFTFKKSKISEIEIEYVEGVEKAEITFRRKEVRKFNLETKKLGSIKIECEDEFDAVEVTLYQTDTKEIRFHGIHLYQHL